MPQTVKLPDGRTFTVPDDATMDEILATANEMDAAPQEPPAAPAREGLAGDVDAMPEGMMKTQLQHGLEGRTMPFAGNLKEAPNVIGTALGKLGQRMYQGLAKPSKGLRQEFPDVVQTALKERVPLTQGGAQKIERLTSQSSQKAKDIIARNDPHTPNIQPGEVVKSFGPVVKELRKRADIGQPSQLSKVGERGKALMASHPQGMSLSRAQELKQTAQAAATGAYRAKDRGLAKELGADDLLDEATAKGLRQTIEKRVPEVADVNKRTQSLMGADRMVGDALSREGNTLGVGGMRDLISAGVGGGLGSVVGMPAEGAAVGLLMRLLSSPGTGSKAAIGLNEASRLPFDQMLRAAMMASHGRQE